ncbi:hypothetical protein GCM10009681_16980 [Luedemannella helvata]|uniref:Uncharacterized protein n=1 Tax=Luedemannella helvata TaxID=349315 RepID=A0ABN2K246_9ACTN
MLIDPSASDAFALMVMFAGAVKRWFALGAVMLTVGAWFTALVGGRLVGTELVGGRLVGTELVGGRLVGTELVGGRLVGTELVGTLLVGVVPLHGTPLTAKLLGSPLVPV